MKIGKSFYWLLGLAILNTIIATNPSLKDNTVFIRLALTCGIVILVCLIWARLSLSGVTVFRNTRELRQQVGQFFVERIDIINQSSLSKVWIKITDCSDLPGSEVTRIISSIKPHSSKSYSSNTLLEHRGTFHLGPTELTSGDIFGVFTYTKRIEAQSSLMVLPYMTDLSIFPVPYGVLPGGKALRQKTTEVTPFSSGVREYLPGDPLRRIHWPTSAKKQKIIVKEFEKDPVSEVWIFLDAREGIHSKLTDEKLPQKSSESFFWMGFRPKFELPPSSLEYAVSAVASIAKYYLDQKREVGLAVSGQHQSIITPERGVRQLEKILNTLSLLGSKGSESLVFLIAQRLNSLIKGSTIVLITTIVDNELLDLCAQLIKRDLMVVVVKVNSTSFGGVKSSTDNEDKLLLLGLVVINIAYGDDLKLALEKANLQIKLRPI